VHRLRAVLQIGVFLALVWSSSLFANDGLIKPIGGVGQGSSMASGISRFVGSTTNSVSPAAADPVTGTGEWTWMGGSSAVNQSGVYGTLRMAAAGNIPGSREFTTNWTDSSGNIWLFGGLGVDANGTFGYLNDLWELNPSTNQWAWMGGSSTVNPPGVYGTLGTAAAGNIPGGRSYTMSWTDGSGNIWLFGGNGCDANGTDGDLNDLWEFNPSTNQWAWMGGSSTVPSSDLGQPGVYGTLGTPAAGNVPGGRSGAVGWTDKSGNLWLFAGVGFDSDSTYRSYLNDLWEFDPSTDQWAWMGGSSTVVNMGPYGYGRPGVYGTLGTAAVGNIPGTRYVASSWADKSGNFWLFGGLGFDANGTYGNLNDFWEFNPASNQWAWMGGSNTVPCNNCGRPGAYGTLGTPAAGNIPGGRDTAFSWTDSSGDIWLFGGDGYNDNGNAGGLNDLWEFTPSTIQWAWMGGSSTVDQSGVYGTLGTPAAGNVPGGRAGTADWNDGSGRFWLFGGQGYDANGNAGYLNDLWEYQPQAPTILPATTTTALTSSQNPSVYGQSLTLNANVTSTARASEWRDRRVCEWHDNTRHGDVEQRHSQLHHLGAAGGHQLDHGGLRRRRELHRQHVDGAQPDGRPGQLVYHADFVAQSL